MLRKTKKKFKSTITTYRLWDKNEDVKYDIKKQKTWEKGVKKCRSFTICLNLNDYQFKTSRYSYSSTYINPMEVTKLKTAL